MEALLLGFVLGIAASVAAAWLVEYGARPQIVVTPPAVWGVQSSYPGPPGPVGVLFFHARVSNVRRRLALLGPRPAWACHASLEIEAEDGSLKLGPVDGRWAAHPEPVAPATIGVHSVLLIDPGKILAGRTIDVHSHTPLEVGTLLKFAGENDCYLFNDHSYYFPQWKNPAWRLPPGSYRLTVTIAYESGSAVRRFRIVNAGNSSPTLVLQET